MKTDDFDEGAEGSVEQNLSYHGAGYSTAGDDISRILTAAAKEKVQEELSLALTEENAAGGRAYSIGKCTQRYKNYH